MGVKSVVLENHRYVPVLRSGVVDELFAYVNFAAAYLLEPGNHAEGG